MATEDFTTYTEVDAGSDITVTSTKVAWTSLDRTVESYVYYDKGVDFFSGNYEHQCELEVTNGSDEEGATFYFDILSNTIDDIKGIRDGGNNYIGIQQYYLSSEPGYGIRVNEYDSVAGGHSSTFYFLTTGQLYYLTIDRDESIGTYGQLRLRVYSDAARTTLLSTLTLSLFTSKKDFRYIFPLNTYNDGSVTAWTTGYLQNLDLQESTFQAVWARQQSSIIGAR